MLLFGCVDGTLQNRVEIRWFWKWFLFSLTGGFFVAIGGWVHPIVDSIPFFNQQFKVIQQNEQNGSCRLSNSGPMQTMNYVSCSFWDSNHFAYEEIIQQQHIAYMLLKCDLHEYFLLVSGDELASSEHARFTLRKLELNLRNVFNFSTINWWYGRSFNYGIRGP